MSRYGPYNELMNLKLIKGANDLLSQIVSLSVVSHMCILY